MTLENKFYEKQSPLLHKKTEILEKSEDSPFKDDREKKYQQINTSTHNRSLEEETMSGKTIWGKNFGGYTILFGSKSEKGLPFGNGEEIAIKHDKYDPSGFRVNKLFDGRDIETVKKAAEVLNSHGLPTEYIRKVNKLETLDINGKTYTIDELKEYLHKKYIADDFKKLPEEKQPFINVMISQYLNSVQFFSIERDMQLGERIQDIRKASTEEDFLKILKKTFRWLNERNKIYAANSARPKKDQFLYTCIQQPDPPVVFEHEHITPKDALPYFVKYLPQQMAQYLARMHSLGLTHGFASFHNWTLAGTLCDLDSVKGKLVNEPDPTSDDVYNDMYETFGAISDIFEPAYVKGERYPSFFHDFLKQQYGNKVDEIMSEAIDTFKDEYMKVRISQGTISDQKIFMKGFADWIRKNKNNN